jgi:ABC-type sugar transport system permease subunit
MTIVFPAAIQKKWLFNYQYGLVNQFLALFGIQGPDWLGDPAWIKSMGRVIWKNCRITDAPSIRAAS